MGIKIGFGFGFGFGFGLVWFGLVCLGHPTSAKPSLDWNLRSVFAPIDAPERARRVAKKWGAVTQGARE